MDLTLAAIGRARPGPHRDLYVLYAGRLRWRLTLKEVEEKRALPPAELARREAELLLAALPPGAALVTLDERGRTLDSQAFADWLAVRRDESRPVAFAIGGASGHGPAVIERADLLLSLGAMTWPHMMVRAMLVEQLYRAQQILADHPYHRG